MHALSLVSHRLASLTVRVFHHLFALGTAASFTSGLRLLALGGTDLRLELVLSLRWRLLVTCAQLPASTAQQRQGI